MSEQWQDKKSREAFEIAEFIKHYERHYGKRFEIVKKSERPDYIVRDGVKEVLYGVELTAVYLSDRSAYEEHIHHGSEILLEDPDVMENYQRRIVRAVAEKVQKARKGYELINPLLLSVYVHEYVAAYLGFDEWKAFELKYKETFTNIAPFIEIVFWPLSNGEAYFIKQNLTGGNCSE
ncbi:MAG: hypothetical protein H6Q68_1633 [Firmicutes bacterium]|nr:hypothetical protein [Bacillota bacterium]